MINRAPLPPLGLAIVVQYWGGDEAASLRLARLLADIEPAPRADVTLVLARRFDVEFSREAWETSVYCGKKFRATTIRAKREGTGHPAGSNALWSGSFEQLAEQYAAGGTDFSTIFTVESDGCPVSVDWIDRLRKEHGLAMHAGKRVVGARMDRVAPHINGTLVAHLSLWADRPSLHRTPPNMAWDLFHAPVLLAETAPTTLILNAYGSRDWTDASIRGLHSGTCWVANCKDTSVIDWAEKNLIGPDAWDGRLGA